MREVVFSFFQMAIIRLLIRHDRHTGAFARALSLFSLDQQRISILSGGRQLSAVYVSAGEDAPAILICHGIGEIVEYWGQVQNLLQSMGISSLVFNYTGYGKSAGIPSITRCEQDAIAAHRELSTRTRGPIFLLGFSMGTGIACAVAPYIAVEGLILCQGFTSLRDAGEAIGFPYWVACILPKIWTTEHSVNELKLPVLIMHSDADRLFPLSMATRVADACKRAEIVVIQGQSHNQPIFSPTEQYWGPVATWILRYPAAKVQPTRYLSGGSPTL